MIEWSLQPWRPSPNNLCADSFISCIFAKPRRTQSPHFFAHYNFNNPSLDLIASNYTATPQVITASTSKRFRSTLCPVYVISRHHIYAMPPICDRWMDTLLRLHRRTIHRDWIAFGCVVNFIRNIIINSLTHVDLGPIYARVSAAARI